MKKQFKVGKVTVKDNDLMDSNDYRSNDGYNKTWKIISDKLIKKLGGYIQVRRVGNIKYLDYLNEYKENSQCIRFRKNLLDLTQCTSAKDIVTCLIPIGKKDSKGNHINISSVNNNTDYIYDKTAVSLYGWIWGIKEFSDIDNESVLLNKAKKYLKDCVNLALTLELSAIDLNMLDVNIERIKVGDRIRVISELHGLDKYFLVTKMSIDLSNPTNNKIVLGDTIVGITEKQIEAQKGASVRLENMNLNIIDAKKNISNVDEKINEVNAEVGSTREELKRQRDFILIGM